MQQVVENVIVLVSSEDSGMSYVWGSKAMKEVLKFDE